MHLSPLRSTVSRAYPKNSAICEEGGKRDSAGVGVSDKLSAKRGDGSRGRKWRMRKEKYKQQCTLATIPSMPGTHCSQKCTVFRESP